MGQLASVVRALDVDKVVWVDDMFAIAPATSIASNIDLAMAVVQRQKLEDLELQDFSADDPDIEGIAERFDSDVDLAARARVLLDLPAEVTMARAILG